MTLFALIVALAPAVLQYWWGRAVLKDRDDPALPERLLALRKRNTITLGIAVGVIVAAMRPTLSWTLPLILITLLVSGYPLRKALYEETWSFGGYLSFFTRLYVAFFGFWILLLALPAIARSTGRWEIVVGSAVGAILLAWNRYYGPVVRWMMRTRPVTDATLLSRFGTLVSASGITPPRFEFVDMRGGFLPNAVALASLRGSSVVFTNSFLEKLNTDEIVAICAHEIAHLEHFNPARLRVLSRLNVTLIAIGVTAAPLVRLASGPSAWFLLLLWPVILLCAMVWLAKDRQKNETDSDVRAVALCGNAEALASALTKLHVMARLPRRWDPEFEKQATHPSLARRLRDIRAAAGTTPLMLDEVYAFAAPDGTTVTFDTAHVRWQEGEAAVHQFSYAHLTQLRVDAPASGTPQLVAVETSGRKWQMPLAIDNVARLQQVLDLVDGRLAHPAPTRSTLPLATVRVLLVIVAVLAVAAMQLAFAIVALVAVIRPAMSVVAAAGVAALSGAVLAMRDNVQDVGTPWTAGVVALVGVGLLALAWQKRHEKAPRANLIDVAVVGILALATTGFVFMYGADAVRVHQGARMMPGSPVLLFALATMLAWRKTPVAWATAAFVGVFGTSIAAAGSTMFLERVGRDPLFVQAPVVDGELLQGWVVNETAVPFAVGELRVSPRGGAIAIRTGDEEEEFSEFYAGLAGQSLTSIKADEVVFTSDTQMLAVRSVDERAELQRIALDRPGTAAPSVAVDVASVSALLFDANTKQWELLGWQGGQRTLVRAQGSGDDLTPHLTRWSRPQGELGSFVSAVATSGPHALTFSKRYEHGWIGEQLLRGWYVPFLSMRSAATISRLGPDGATHVLTSKLETECTANAMPQHLVCATYDDVRTTVVSIDPASGAIAPIGAIDGRFFALSTHSPGWLTGWHNGAVAAFDLDARKLIYGVRTAATAIAAGDTVVATASYADTPIVRVVSIEK